MNPKPSGNLTTVRVLWNQVLAICLPLNLHVPFETPGVHSVELFDPVHVFGDTSGPQACYEFVAKCIQEWLGRLQISALYVPPGSPWENGSAESFQSKLVDEYQSRERFESMTTARDPTVAWKDDDNHDRPHRVTQPELSEPLVQKLGAGRGPLSLSWDSCTCTT